MFLGIFEVVDGISEGHWLVDLAVIAAGAAGAGYILRNIVWRLLLVPVAKAIAAAPQIADGIQELTRIIEADVLAQIRASRDEGAVLSGLVQGHQSTIDEHSARLQSLDNGVADLARRFTEHEAARPLDGGDG